METPRDARLLVVDDEIASLKLVKTMLTRAHYQVVICGSGAEALRMITQARFDCVITDAVMPTMTGYDLVRMLRRHPQFSEIPILMLTRKRHRLDVKKAVDAGVTDYVLKPIDEHLLLEKVELCIKKGAGKKHVFEAALNGIQGEVQLQLFARVVVISESGLSLRSSVPLADAVQFELVTKIFEDIGIRMPILKLLKCVENPIPEDLAIRDLPYECRFGFAGVQETDLRKIRTWLQRQELRRKK